MVATSDRSWLMRVSIACPCRGISSLISLNCATGKSICMGGLSQCFEYRFPTQSVGCRIVRLDRVVRQQFEAGERLNMSDTGLHGLTLNLCTWLSQIAKARVCAAKLRSPPKPPAKRRRGQAERRSAWPLRRSGSPEGRSPSGGAGGSAPRGFPRPYSSARYWA